MHQWIINIFMSIGDIRASCWEMLNRVILEQNPPRPKVYSPCSIPGTHTCIYSITIDSRVTLLSMV